MFQMVEEECFLLDKVSLSPNIPVPRTASWMRLSEIICQQLTGRILKRYVVISSNLKMFDKLPVTAFSSPKTQKRLLEQHLGTPVV